MSTGGFDDTGYDTFETADTTIATRYLRVKMSGTRTITVSGASAEDDIGVARVAQATAGINIGVLTWGKPGTFPMTANGAITANALVYPAAAGKISATVLGAPLGRAIEAASGDLSIIEVQVFRGYRHAVHQITDPGNLGAIPVTHTGFCPLVTAGAETRTAAAPTFPGQRLTLSMQTDGGDCVVTIASVINQTGNNTITFNDVGDVLDLVAINKSGSLVWRTVCSDGTSLTTV